MSTQWKRYSAELKVRVALEALKGHKTVLSPTDFVVGEELVQTIG